MTIVSEIRNPGPERARSRLFGGVCGTLFVLAVLGVAGNVQAAAETAAPGEIYGSVALTRALSAQRMRFRLYSTRKPQAPPDAAGYRSDEWDNVVIYLETEATLPSREPDQEHPQMLQQGETFIPHVLPVRVGTTVDFPNHDPIFHNVFSLSRVSTFDLGRYPEGESRSVTFDRAGIVPVFCHLHSDMSAIVLVLQNDLFSKPDEHGGYRLAAVAPGEYTLVAWHPRSDPVRVPVVIGPGESLELDLTVPIVDETVPE